MANRFLNNIRINDEYTLPSQDGTSGQVISTDGVGNLSFVDATTLVTTAESGLVYYEVKNSSGSTINKGKAVQAVGTDGNSGHILIDEMVADGSVESKYFIGVLETSIDNGDIGRVIHFGELDQFNTLGQNGETWNDGDILWLDPSNSGDYTITEPNGPNIKVAAAIIKNAATNGKIHIRVQANEGINDLHDTRIVTQADGDLLIWDNTLNVWKNDATISVDYTNNIVTVDGKIYYSNVFATLSDLPSATTYHGMFAHVHAEAAAYYAHAGSWVKLANYSDLSGAANDSTITITAGTGLTGGGTFTTDQATDSSVTVNLADTAVTPGTYGDANNTPQITIDQQGRITSATTVATAGSGSGGGGGGAELSIERDVFTATANQTVFTISSAITASSNTQVYIDGVYQAKSNYTTSGSTITFSTGVPAGAEVEVVHFISVYSKIYTDTFTGDASTVNFTASKDVTDENVTQVYIDGVYQSKDNYTTSGTTITFSTAPPSGSAIEVVHFTAVEYSTLSSNQFTGTGSQTDFILTQGVTVDNSFVFIQGVYQEKDTYSISGTTLTFTTAPLSGYSIEVITIGSVSATGDLVTSFNGATGDITFAGGTNWVSDPKTANFTAVAGEGYFVNTTSAAITVTLPSSPTTGDEVSIVDYAGTADTNNITITSSDNINGSSDDVTINYERGGVSMVYVDATQGWIAYNAANETATALPTDITPLTVDYLVVAGGGGGGSRSGAGGGGAGGLRTSYGSTSGGGASAESSLNLSVSTNYSLTVGGGGTGAGSNDGSNSTNGSNSVFSTITSTGGGKGSVANGGSGGSGGGDGRGSTANTNTGTSNQGYSGGNDAGNSTYSGAGGGGASAIGSNASSSAGGAGGAGLAVNIISTSNAGTASVGEVSGSDVYFAAGGGGSGADYSGTHIGGSGGIGGGGDGATVINSVGPNGDDGTTNTGSGGGGGAWTSSQVYGGDGGSGVVILRYPSAYSITVGAGITEASGSPFTEGSDKVSIFTAGTGNISFS